jgi:hypothetical protein
MCISIYVYVCMCVCVCVYVYVCMCVCVCVLPVLLFLLCMCRAYSIPNLTPLSTTYYPPISCRLERVDIVGNVVNRLPIIGK